ncbi:AAA family ATPase [Streptomyces sp. NPDC005811]|uniref:AAA family ATPase n=1 Tax=Streptomyces sp. NPDC005811 TaxID=3154565 RepID=UPI0033FC14BD
MVTVGPHTNELVRWGRHARMDCPGDVLLGREQESGRIDDLLSDSGGPRLVLVRGERGVGRSAFLRATGERLRAKGIAVHAVDCATGEGDRPLLLALRLVMAVQERRSEPEGRQPAAGLVAQALSAADRQDQVAMEAVLRTALTRRAPVMVLVDDAQHADPGSLAALGRIDVPGVRMVVSVPWHTAPTATGARTSTLAPAREDARRDPADATTARTVVLLPLHPHDTTALVARWLHAEADTGLARRVGELTRGLPGAVEALLTGWTQRGVIRIADGRAFIPARAEVPTLPDDDRFVTALDRLGEPERAVAAALSILGPLGRPALRMTAACTGLSTDLVHDSARRLIEAGVVDEVPGPDATTVRGWTFRLALTAHTVRERMSPVRRSRLSAAAVEVLWKEADAERTGPAVPPAPGLLDETDALAYHADRLADAGSLVDRERAVGELTAAARKMRPGTDDGRVLRWLRAARDLTEHADARDLVLQQYGTAAYLACDYPTARASAESLLRDPGPLLSDLDLQEAACLIVAVTANQRDWPTMSRLATTHWWDALPVPDLAKVTGQALALCHLSQWQETADLLKRTETVWNTGPRARAAPDIFHAMAELALGRPQRYRRALAMSDASRLPPGKVYSLASGMFDNLLTRYDLTTADTLLKTTGLTVHVLPPLSQFLHHHLTGRWDLALESARRLLAAHDIQSTPVADSSLLPARTAAILLAQGRVTSALHLVQDLRGPDGSPPQCALHASEAELLMTLGRADQAERTLCSGLDSAQAHDQIYGTDELWAQLAEVTARTGRDREATACLRHLEHIAHRTGTDRSHLLYLLASARVRRREAPDTARRDLHEAVDLARLRGLPFETATTLVAAATAGAVPATLLHEAYELFDLTGAALWRFHTRTALREAGLTVPSRKQATTENDRLLATLLAEQLTTPQIAAVLRLTEDAAARRLSRLLARTGKRSRTELVTASLTGSL